MTKEQMQRLVASLVPSAVKYPDIATYFANELDAIRTKGDLLAVCKESGDGDLDAGAEIVGCLAALGQSLVLEAAAGGAETGRNN